MPSAWPRRWTKPNAHASPGKNTRGASRARAHGARAAALTEERARARKTRGLRRKPKAARLREEQERLTQAQAERDRLTRMALERKRAQAEFAAQERRATERLRQEEDAKVAAARQAAEQEARRATEAAAAERLLRPNGRAQRTATRRTTDEGRKPSRPKPPRSSICGTPPRPRKPHAYGMHTGARMKKQRRQEKAARKRQDLEERAAAKPNRGALPASAPSRKSASLRTSAEAAIVQESAAKPVSESLGLRLKGWWEKIFFTTPVAPRPVWDMARGEPAPSSAAAMHVEPAVMTVSAAEPSATMPAPILRDMQAPPPANRESWESPPAMSTVAPVQEPKFRPRLHRPGWRRKSRALCGPILPCAPATGLRGCLPKMPPTIRRGGSRAMGLPTAPKRWPMPKDAIPMQPPPHVRGGRRPGGSIVPAAAGRGRHWRGGVGILVGAGP